MKKEPKRKYEIEREDLNLDDIEIGQIFNSYPDLCKALGIKAKRAGDSRSSQIKELKQYICFEYISRKKLEVKNIFIVKKEKEDNRRDGNNVVYREEFETVLLSILYKEYKNNGKRFLCSKSRMIELLGFANKNYGDYRRNPYEIAKKLKIPNENLLEFYTANYTRMTKNIQNNLICFDDKYYDLTISTAVCVKTDDEKYPYRYRLATEEELLLIRECKETVFKKLKVKTFGEILREQLWDIYNDKMEKEFIARDSRIKYSYESYYFVIDSDIEETYRKHLKDKDTNATKSKSILNKKSTNATFESIERRQQLAFDRISKSDTKTKNDILITNDDFKKHSKKMTNNLISLNAKRLVSTQLTMFDNENEKASIPDECE